MKLKRTLQAVAVVAATGSCFLLPHEATLAVKKPGFPDSFIMGKLAARPKNQTGLGPHRPCRSRGARRP